ncbi:MAG: phosphoribosylamine--glycine ligase [Psychroflexus sp.]|nr:phosphoribosylamine--glycine ligase [Psychroflexus sp.]
MNVLILGSGGREHALAWRISKSQHLNQLYVAPGNAGTLNVATNIPIVPTEFLEIKNFVLKNNIKMIIVGPEAPLVQGIKDFFDETDLKDVHIIAPSKAAAMLEGSKDFAKLFMQENNIPTAKYQTFTAFSVDDGKAFLEKLKPPYVLKADGLAGGKGVLILDDIKDAKSQLEAMLLHDKFGDAANQVVIEEFLDGTEVSVFVLTDGYHYKILPTAKDYKRIGDGDKGLNTGGMGAVSPNLLADDHFLKKVEQSIIKPTLNGLQKRNYKYKGFLFLGLMIINNDPYVIEYNVRLGDPETQAILPRIETDLLALLIKTGEGKLNDIDLKIDQNFSASLILASAGYPGKYEKGKVITGLESLDEDQIVFHAGTKKSNGDVLTSGGRVLAVTSLNAELKTAISQSYAKATKIKFNGKYSRTDIGEDLLNIQKSN